MARNTGKGHRNGSVTGRIQKQNPKTGNWEKVNPETGKVVDVKSDGEPFKGVAKYEDGRRK